MKAHTHLYLLFFLLLCFLACQNKNGPNQDMPIEAFEYLEAEAKAISVANPIHLASLAAVLADHQFILTGESHGIAFNYDLELMMLQFLVEEDWLDYYVPELPFSFCYFLNQYLENGDETILDRLFAPLEGTFTWTQEAKAHWQHVRDLFQSLPPDKRFTVVGIEVEHQARNAQWMMQDLLPSANPPAFLAEKIESLHQLVTSKNDNYLELYNLALSLKSLLINQSGEMKTFLGANFNEFSILNQLVIDTHEARFDDTFSTKREALIYQSFLRNKDLFSSGNSYGQWGANHIYQHDIEGVDWLANKLNAKENSPLQGRVYSILYLYHDCKALFKDPYRKANFSNLFYVRDFKKISNQDITFFRLDRPGSPFQEQLIWPSTSLLLSEGVTTDYVQSLFLIRESPAASPLN